MLHPGPETAAALYNLLRTTPPYDRWKLPPADEVGFTITHSYKEAGRFYVDAKDVPHIELSAKCAGTLQGMLPIMGHEMIHLRIHLLGIHEYHGPNFRRLGLGVCHKHQFDPMTFGGLETCSLRSLK